MMGRLLVGISALQQYRLGIGPAEKGDADRQIFGCEPLFGAYSKLCSVDVRFLLHRGSFHTALASRARAFRSTGCHRSSAVPTQAAASVRVITGSVYSTKQAHFLRPSLIFPIDHLDRDLDALLLKKRCPSAERLARFPWH
jgi:hypothetical protein